MVTRMKLYHFTCDHGAKGIPREGITRGAVTTPYRNAFRIERGWQWLTTNPEPGAQGWATSQNLGCNRRQFRLEVDIPREHEHRLYTWARLKLAMPWPLDWIAALESVGGSSDWYVYGGRIPAAWVTRLTESLVGPYPSDADAPPSAPTADSTSTD